MWSIALAALSALLLQTSVRTGFTPVRVKLVTSEIASQAGSVSIPLTGSPRIAQLGGGPGVVVARVRNAGETPIAVTFLLDAEPFSTITVAPGASLRVDAAVPDRLPLRPGGLITLRSDRDRWSLESLEAANIHGGSNQWLKFVIVPSGASVPGQPSLSFAILIAAVVLGLAVLGAARTPPASRWATRLWRAVAGVILLFLLAVLISGSVSRFKLLLAPDTFGLCIALLVAPGLRHAFLWARGQALRRLHWPAAAVDSVLVALAVAAFYGSILLVLLASYNGNASALITIAERNAVHFPPLMADAPLARDLVLHEGTGYDAQFAYFATFDPFLSTYAADPAQYSQFIDATPYRYGRIGFSLLTKLLSADRPRLYPAVMVGLVLIANVAGAFVLARIFVHYGRSPAWALLYLIVPGFVASLHFTLPESIAGAALLAGYWCWLRARPGWAAALFAASLLVRETGILLIFALVCYELFLRRRPADALLLASSGLGLAAWRGYVCWRLFPDWGWRGLFFNPENLGVPLRGFADLWASPDLTPAGTWYPVLLIAALALSAALCWIRRDGISLAVLLYAAVAVSLNYKSIWVAVGNGERGTYELALFLIVAFAGLDRQATRLRHASLALFAGLAWYQLFAAVDASIVRQALAL